MGEIEAKPESIEGELKEKELHEVVSAISGIISPLADAQTKAHVEQIRANKEYALENLRVRERAFNRLYWILVALVLVGSTIVLTLLFTGKTDAAMNAFWFFIGALSGYMGSRHIGNNAPNDYSAQ